MVQMSEIVGGELKRWSETIYFLGCKYCEKCGRTMVKAGVRLLKKTFGY